MLVREKPGKGPSWLLPDPPGKDEMPQLRKISSDALREALQAHLLWLKFPSRGRKGDLSFCNLPGIDLSRIDLSRITLSGANLAAAKLVGDRKSTRLNSSH